MILSIEHNICRRKYVYRIWSFQILNICSALDPREAINLLFQISQWKMNYFNIRQKGQKYLRNTRYILWLQVLPFHQLKKIVDFPFSPPLSQKKSIKNFPSFLFIFNREWNKKRLPRMGTKMLRSRVIISPFSLSLCDKVILYGILTLCPNIIIFYMLFLWFVHTISLYLYLMLLSLGFEWYCSRCCCGHWQAAKRIQNFSTGITMKCYSYLRVFPKYVVVCS